MTSFDYEAHVDDSNPNGVLELPIENPYKDQIVEDLTRCLTEVYNDRITSIFIVAERPSGEGYTRSWSSAIDPTVRSARVFDALIRLMGYVETDDVQEMIEGLEGAD